MMNACLTGCALVLFDRARDKKAESRRVPSGSPQVFYPRSAFEGKALPRGCGFLMRPRLPSQWGAMRCRCSVQSQLRSRAGEERGVLSTESSSQVKWIVVELELELAFGTS